MADSAPDPKVEDVLSSVRRLVAQEIPKRRTTRQEPQDGALILTSQDRIETDSRARADKRSLEERIAELEAAVDSGKHEFEPDGSEDQAQHRPDRIVFTRPRPSEADVGRSRTSLRLSEIALVDRATESSDDEIGDEPVQFRHDRQALEPGLGEAPMAEDVPTLPASSAEVHAFSDPDDVVARIEARIERGGDDPEPPASQIVSTSAPKSESIDFDAQLTAAVRASISGSEASGTDPETIEPRDSKAENSEQPAPTPRATTPTAESSSSEAAERGNSEPEAEPVQDDPAPLVLTPSEQAATALDAVPDEEAMRLLVGRLIRQELQGDLGEKITHNVRKLVRSEVKRILQSRELD